MKSGGARMIKFEDVSKVYEYNNTKTIALNNINLEINKGDIFGVIGQSGAGKSTLIRTINFLEKPSSGRVFIDGTDLNTYQIKELRTVRKDIGMIFQHFNLLNSKTIFQNIAVPLVLAKVDKRTIKDRVTELLEFVGLTEKADQYPNELSGGQKQRIGIARALAMNPSILLCDEATSALDPETTDSILNLIKKINEAYNITIIMITHEMSIIQKICNRVAVMEKGEIIETENVLDLFKNPKQHSTKNFVRSIIQDQIPSNVRTKIIPLEGSRIFKIDFNNLTNIVLKKLMSSSYLTVNILFATMNEIKEHTIGHMIIQLAGETTHVSEAFSYLNKAEVNVKELSLNA